MIDTSEATFAAVKRHPRWNAERLRIELTPEELTSLPFKDVDGKELSDVLCQLDYNPVHLYPAGAVLRNRELGHDLNYRYRLAIGALNSDPKKPEIDQEQDREHEQEVGA